MKSQLRLIVLLSLLLNAGLGYAQTAGVTSGSIYTLTSKTGNKLLDVSNSSTENGARVDCWTNTHSDAQRWTVTHIGKGVYTLTNLASGKLLHTAAAPADSVNIDQTDNAGNDDVKWIIKKAGSGVYYLKPAADNKFSLNLSNGGAGVNLSSAPAGDAQKWTFQKEKAQDAALTISTANKVFDAWYNQYKVETSKGFWDKAEMMEILLDAYEVTKDAKYATRFNTMYTNFMEHNKTDWMYNNYNDDITWAALFCVRGYLLTGNKTYLEKGKEQFDKMYARAFTNKYGGGLTWFETKTSKNACINGPAMVACCYLAKATGDNTYYDKAIALYSWSKIYLFDAHTGKVNDNIDLDHKTGLVRTGNWSSTYNQGTYLGAAVMLYNYTKEASYLEEAKKIAQFTRDEMFRGKVIDNEDGGDDLPGFKGIFARYARTYTLEGHQTDLVDWMTLNANTAYNNRNSQNLIHTKWATRTGEAKPKSSFGCSTAVSLLFNTIPLKN
jgi:predicted alpha-1,6-mannanase (GH76 family)